MRDEALKLSGQSFLLGSQHALAAVGGIIAAPLIIAMGMGLSASQTSYLISAALVISGLATVLQIVQIGPLGSGLLSLQGTSFAFVGPLIFLYHGLVETHSSDAALGILFGSALVCAGVMIVLTTFVKTLRQFITSNVSGLTLVLIGGSLMETTARSLFETYSSAAAPGPFLWVCGITLVALLGLSLGPWPRLRLVSILAGLVLGTLAASFFGWLDGASLNVSNGLFLPKLMPFGFGIDWMVVVILLPIFLVSATESIGDLTATSALSGHSYGDAAYWRRLRGGLMGDAVNSGLASVFGTFPNTTFSQNNGLIRLSGAARPTIGLYAAGLLCLLGLLPVLAEAIQVIPDPVISTTTFILFGLVAWAGLQVFKSNARSWRCGLVFLGGLGGGYWVAGNVETWTVLPGLLIQVLAFPVSTGAFIGLMLEAILPGRARVPDVH